MIPSRASGWAVLLAAYVVMGRGLGASGAVSSLVS
jgi:hypothetical protein